MVSLTLTTTHVPLIGALLDIFLIFSGLAGWTCVAMLCLHRRDLKRQIARTAEPVLDRGVALAAQAMLDTNGRVFDNPSALSFERKRREADALRDEPFAGACLCANTGRACPVCVPSA